MTMTFKVHSLEDVGMRGKTKFTLSAGSPLTRNQQMTIVLWRGLGGF